MSYQTFKRKEIISLNFFFLKNNNETNKQEQNISINPKKNLLDTLHGQAFKATQ